MSIEERVEIVACVQETYALMGYALGTQATGRIRETAINPVIIDQLAYAEQPYVTDAEMRDLLLPAYVDLVDNVLRLQEELLGESGGRYDQPLAQVGLTESGLRVKARGFRRALQRLPGIRWVKKAFEWGNIILGSLGAVPGVGIITEPIQELKEAIEAQGDDDQTS